MTATEVYRAARDQLIELRGQHELAVEKFRWPEISGSFNWATDWFDVVARDNDRLALWIVEEDGREQRVTFDEMARRSDQVAAWLSTIGVSKGDAVMVMLGNQLELWEALLAIMKVGAVIVPTTPAVGPAELVDRIDRAEAKHVIVNGADAGKFDEVPGDYGRIAVAGDVPTGWTDYREAYGVTDPPRPNPGTMATDPLLLYFTSGTTSRPKLVEHTQTSYPVGHLTTFYWIGGEPGDVHMCIASPGWAKHAWSAFFAPWIAEATIFVYNYARFDAAALLDQIRRARVTTFCAPPTVWRMLIQADLSGGPGSIREAVAAGEPLNPEVIDQVSRHWGLTLRDGFGQTELTCSVANTPGAPVKPGSMGRPLPGCAVALLDPVTGDQSDEGEICVDLSAHPANLMTGYRGDPERQAEVTAGGWYHTGDVASRDDEGYLTYIGRTDDVFKASDYKVSPFELESVLLQHPAVAEAAVVPAPDPVRLAVPKAYVSLAAGWEPDADTARQVLAFARENLAPFLRVRRVEFSELPKTISGKIRRVDLRRREIDDSELAAKSEWRDDQFPELRSTS